MRRSRTISPLVAISLVVLATSTAPAGAATRSQPQITVGGWTAQDMKAWHNIATRLGVNCQQVADAKLAAQWQAVADRVFSARL